MEKLIFTRKAVDLDELKRRTLHAVDGNQVVVEKIVELPDERYKEFSESLLTDFDFIEDNKDLMHVDTYGVWHCILVKAEEGQEGILVEASGYDYARYSSYVPDIQDFLK